MYKFRGAALQDAVHQALRYPAVSTKKLAKVAAKFDFTARMRTGSVLFVGEGNLSFALTMSRKPRVSASSILATVYEAEEDLTDTAYDNARKLLKLGCSVKTGVDATQLSDTIGKRQFRTIKGIAPACALCTYSEDVRRDGEKVLQTDPDGPQALAAFPACPALAQGLGRKRIVQHANQWHQEIT